MKRKHRNSVSSIYFIIIFICPLFFSSCKKGKFDSKYTTLIQHKWLLKSQGKQRSVNGRVQSPWKNAPLTGTYYREFSKDGTYTVTSDNSSFVYTTPYELRSEVILYMHPATIGMPYSDPDTSFIRSVNDTEFVMYNRKYFGSNGYSSLDETLDTLTR